MKLPRPARRAIRSTVGIWPAFEMRNRLVGVPAGRRNRRFQQEQVTRILAQRGGAKPHARVLVVVPTYRRPEGVLRSIRSALAQSYDDLVVVVVDDGGGLPHIEPDPRVVAVSLSRNSATLGLVRNVGIELAESEFIAFLDDDNEWTPDHLAVSLRELIADPGLSAVYTAVRRLRPDGSELDVLSQPFDRRALREDAFVDANSIVVRRSDHPGFSVLPRQKLTLPKEDWEYVWRLSKRGRIRHVPEVTVLYAVNPDSYYTTWGGGTLGPEVLQ